MFTVEQSIVINRPIEQVFAYVTNPNNITKWRPDVLAINGAGDAVVAGDSSMNWLISVLQELP